MRGLVGAIGLVACVSGCTRTVDVLSVADGSIAADAGAIDARPDVPRDLGVRDLGRVEDLGRPEDAGPDARVEEDAATVDAGLGPCELGATVEQETIEIPYATGASAPRIATTDDGFLLLYETDPRITGARVPAVAHLDTTGGPLPPLAPIHALAEGLGALVAVGQIDDRVVAVVRTLDGRLRAWAGDPAMPDDSIVLELDVGAGRVGAGASVSASGIDYLSHGATPDATGAFPELRLGHASLDGTVSAPVDPDLSFASATLDPRLSASFDRAWVTSITGRTITVGTVELATGNAVTGEIVSPEHDEPITSYAVAGLGAPAASIDRADSVFLVLQDGTEMPVAVGERDPTSGASTVAPGEFSFIVSFWATGRRAPTVRGYAAFGGAPSMTAELDESTIDPDVVHGSSMDSAGFGSRIALAYVARTTDDEGASVDRLYVARFRFCMPFGGL